MTVVKEPKKMPTTSPVVTVKNDYRIPEAIMAIGYAAILVSLALSLFVVIAVQAFQPVYQMELEYNLKHQDNRMQSDVIRQVLSRDFHVCETEKMMYIGTGPLPPNVCANSGPSFANITYSLNGIEWPKSAFKAVPLPLVIR